MKSKIVLLMFYGWVSSVSLTQNLIVVTRYKTIVSPSVSQVMSQELKEISQRFPRIYQNDDIIIHVINSSQPSLFFQQQYYFVHLFRTLQQYISQTSFVHIYIYIYSVHHPLHSYILIHTSQSLPPLTLSSSSSSSNQLLLIN